jgi:L-amino acid N-acyltransferase YncA
MTVRDATESDLPAILDIYNDAVLNTLAIWNENPVDLANRRQWMKDRQGNGYPILVATRDSEILGYASFGDFRPFDGYRFTVEHSLYVHPRHRRQGIGRALMLPLIERARQLGKQVMVGAIEGGNEASIQLHLKLGFEKSGQMREVGFKFDRWLDLVFVQKALNDQD